MHAIEVGRFRKKPEVRAMQEKLHLEDKVFNPYQIFRVSDIVPMDMLTVRKRFHRNMMVYILMYGVASGLSRRL